MGTFVRDLSQGSAFMRFRRALVRGNVTDALSAAGELQFVGLAEALELTLLLAEGEESGHEPVLTSASARQGRLGRGHGRHERTRHAPRHARREGGRPQANIDWHERPRATRRRPAAYAPSAGHAV